MMPDILTLSRTAPDILPAELAAHYGPDGEIAALERPAPADQRVPGGRPVEQQDVLPALPEGADAGRDACGQPMGSIALAYLYEQRRIAADKRPRLLDGVNNSDQLTGGAVMGSCDGRICGVRLAD